MGDRFGGLDAGQENQLVTEVWNWVIRQEARERDAADRHKELLGKVDTFTGALAAGMRAFADALDRARR